MQEKSRHAIYDLSDSSGRRSDVDAEDRQKDISAKNQSPLQLEFSDSQRGPPGVQGGRERNWGTRLVSVAILRYLRFRNQKNIGVLS